MENIKGIIFDIDGVLVFQGKIYAGAIETLQALREKGIVLRFLTNSTLKSRRSAAEKLRKAGFQVYNEEVVTASYATARYLEGLKPHSCWVMVDGDGKEEFQGFRQDEENPEYLVVGDNRSQFDFEHLNRALRALAKGAQLIGMQAELLDTSMGELELNVGAWVEMLARASGVPATYIGKPAPFAFELSLQTMGLEKNEVIMVGDRVSTDIQGARDFGLRSALIKTGEYHIEELDMGIIPDFIIDSIQEVLHIIS